MLLVIGNYEFHDGTVTSVNPETRDIAVTYKTDDIFYAGNPQKVITVKFMCKMGSGIAMLLEGLNII